MWARNAGYGVWLFQQLGHIDSLIFSADAVGDLTVQRAEHGYIEMSFPSRKPQPVADIPAALRQGLSIPPQAVYSSQQAYFAVYECEQDVLDVIQTPSIIQQLGPLDVVVTAASNQYDFISRYFWPANGGDEDPVTGSIHAGLAPLWAEKLGKCDLVAYQASARGGKLLCRVAGGRVYISGQAVQYLEGVIGV